MFLISEALFWWCQPWTPCVTVTFFLWPTGGGTVGDGVLHDFYFDLLLKSTYIFPVFILRWTLSVQLSPLLCWVVHFYWWFCVQWCFISCIDLRLFQMPYKFVCSFCRMGTTGFSNILDVYFTTFLTFLYCALNKNVFDILHLYMLIGEVCLVAFWLNFI